MRSKKASYTKHQIPRKTEREKEREKYEKYTVRWKLRACWWSRSRTDARAGGSITSPMIYPTESSLLLRCEEEKKQESESEKERKREY